MTGEASTAEVRGWKGRVLAHLRSGQVSKIVYGSIIGLALVLTLEAHPSTSGVAIGSLVATGLAVGLAELYSEVIGSHTKKGLGEEHAPIAEVVEETAAVIIGVAFPAVFFVGSAIGLWELDTAFQLAKWTGLGLIAGLRLPRRPALGSQRPARPAPGQRGGHHRGAADRVQGGPALTSARAQRRPRCSTSMPSADSTTSSIATSVPRASRSGPETLIGIAFWRT